MQISSNLMDSKRLTAFRNELYETYAKGKDDTEKERDATVELDDLVNTQVGLSLFNQTAALGNLHSSWVIDIQLKCDMQRSEYATIIADGWEMLSPHLEEVFVNQLCNLFVHEDGALLCSSEAPSPDSGVVCGLGLNECDATVHSGMTLQRTALLSWLAQELHSRLIGVGMGGLGRCAAVHYPLCAVLPGPKPQRVRGSCHAVFWHGSDVTLVDFRVRRLALPATADILRLALYKALGVRVGLAPAGRLRVATLIAFLDPERPRLRLWTYTLSKQMDEAIMSLDCVSQVLTLLQRHVTEVLT